MKDLVEYVVKSLVSNTEAVVVEESSSEDGVRLLLTVAPEDMGLVIGKAGQTIKAIRRLVLIRAMTENVRVNLELNEVGERPGEEKEEPESSVESAEPVKSVEPVESVNTDSAEPSESSEDVKE